MSTSLDIAATPIPPRPPTPPQRPTPPTSVGGTAAVGTTTPGPALDATALLTSTPPASSSIVLSTAPATRPRRRRRLATRWRRRWPAICDLLCFTLCCVLCCMLLAVLHACFTLCFASVAPYFARPLHVSRTRFTVHFTRVSVCVSVCVSHVHFTPCAQRETRAAVKRAVKRITRCVSRYEC